MYALVCRSDREAEYLQGAIISALARFRQRSEKHTANTAIPVKGGGDGNGKDWNQPGGEA